MAPSKSLTYMFHTPSRQWARFDSVVPYVLQEQKEGQTMCTD